MTCVGYNQIIHGIFILDGKFELEVLYELIFKFSYLIFHGLSITEDIFALIIRFIDSSILLSVLRYQLILIEIIFGFIEVYFLMGINILINISDG